MTEDEAISALRKIMLDYAELTGLDPAAATPRRYLWTDSFALCNYLELERRTGEERWRELALRLVEQVHRILGRHRPDSRESGWISGLGEAEGELHPTAGGLRIGKPLDERKPGDRPDERLEWDRDGQYYHYLTKWMHALHRVSRAAGDPAYLRWALELAKVAHARFSHATSRGGAKRLYWKMSIDLSRPQVASMGQHDPLDGLVTCCELQAAAKALSTPGLPDLKQEISELALACRSGEWGTEDPLGIGGLLCDASTIAQLASGGVFAYYGLLAEVIDAALPGLAAVAETDLSRLPARYRLAFRELGLSIGLRGIERLLASTGEQHPPLGELGSLRPQLELVTSYLPLAQKIESFWLGGANREKESWKEHREINMVMLGTSLAPDEFLKAV